MRETHAIPTTTKAAFKTITMTSAIGANMPMPEPAPLTTTPPAPANPAPPGLEAAAEGSEALHQQTAKRRRGGRRATNPEISAEERKRQRVLKNRESAMRSLAKKAEYSAKLEKLETEATTELNDDRQKLQKVVSNAIALRNLLATLPDDVTSLVRSQADAGIAKGVAQLASNQVGEEHASTDFGASWVDSKSQQADEGS